MSFVVFKVVLKEVLVLVVEKFDLKSLDIEDQEEWLLDVAWYSSFPEYDELQDWYELGQDHVEFVRVWKLRAASAWSRGAWYMFVQGVYEHSFKICVEDHYWSIYEATNVTEPELIGAAENLSDALNYVKNLCRRYDYTREVGK